LIVTNSSSHPEDIKPGKDRWSIKTSFIKKQKIKNVALVKLLSLDNPIEKSSKEFDDKRIANSVNGLKEGDLITTKGWMKLVAFENKNGGDGDYHIQLRSDSLWAYTCLIVEIPMSEFIKDDKALRDSCKNAREFICAKILKDKNKEPASGGNVIGKAYVSVTGALFFDAHHINANPLRGKKGNQKKTMSSYTCWELHPVIHIEFAMRP